jgi:hypothetical protein
MHQLPLTQRLPWPLHAPSFALGARRVLKVRRGSTGRAKAKTREEMLDVYPGNISIEPSHPHRDR